MLDCGVGLLQLSYPLLDEENNVEADALPRILWSSCGKIVIT